MNEAFSGQSNLDDVLADQGDLVDYFRNLPTDTWEFVGVPREFTNWRDEQLAGHETAVLLHQGHMRHPLSEFYVTGPDAFRLLNDLGVNSFTRFEPGMAKQYVACNYEGYLIGDCVLLYLAPEKFCLVGSMVLQEWIRFHGKRGGYNAAFSNLDTVVAADGSEHSVEYYQFQLQGPKARAIFERLNGSYPDLKFFRIGKIEIAGHEVNCLSHSMLGEPGMECWFPLEHRDAVIGAIVEAGREFGLKQVGTRTYPTQTLESGWMGLPLPGIYEGERYREYREFLAADGFEAMFSIAGSFVGQKISDYYYTPYEMNYGNFVKFDHDFIGREALEAMAARPHARKVTLIWNADDVARMHAMGTDGNSLPAKFFDLPWAPYGMVQCDRVSVNDRTVGRSADVGFSHYCRATMSLAVIDPDVQLGDEVVVTWGEEDGGTRKFAVERHRQMSIRAIVCPAPYTKVAREQYHPGGWRDTSGA